MSKIQILKVDFVENINRILNEYNVKPNQIYFEITETIFQDLYMKKIFNMLKE